MKHISLSELGHINILVALNTEKAEKAAKGSSYFVKGHQSLSLGESTGWDGGPVLAHHPNPPGHPYGDPPRVKCCPEVNPSPRLFFPAGFPVEPVGSRRWPWALPGTVAEGEEPCLAPAGGDGSESSP